MFWAMMYLLFFSGSAAPELSYIPDETAFRNAINDPVRLEQVLTIREEAKAAELLLANQFKHSYSELAELSPNYETDSESFAAIFADLESARIAVQKALLDQRFRLKEHMTKKEWNKVFRNR